MLGSECDLKMYVGPKVETGASTILGEMARTLRHFNFRGDLLKFCIMQCNGHGQSATIKELIATYSQKTSGGSRGFIGFGRTPTNRTRVWWPKTLELVVSE